MYTIKFKDDGINSNRRLASLSPLCSSDIPKHIMTFEKESYAKPTLKELKNKGHDVKIAPYPYKDKS